MSFSAVRPVSVSWSRADLAFAGSRSRAAPAPSARVIMTDRLCATMSCISRAIRLRSASVAICAWLSRSRASCSARSVSARTRSARCQVFAPSSTPTVSAIAIVSSTTGTSNAVGVPSRAESSGSQMKRLTAVTANAAAQAIQPTVGERKAATE